MDSGEASSFSSLRSPARTVWGGSSCGRAERGNLIPIKDIRIIGIRGIKGGPFLSVLMLVIEDVGLGPVLSPAADSEGFFPAPGRRANDPVEAGVDDHLLTDETGKGVDRLFLAGGGPVGVNCRAGGAYPC